MARRREQRLADLLVSAGFQIERPGPKCDALIASSSIRDSLDVMYRALGGTQEEYPRRVGRWDLAFGDVLVELDEEQHFNRYRAQTLSSPIYHNCSAFVVVDYQTQCHHRERECVAKCHGGYWTNPSCERQFGPADPIRTFREFGSPRCKQRAFYDLLKDASVVARSSIGVRFSIWESIRGISNPCMLVDILENKVPATVDILAYLRSRIEDQMN